MHKLAIILGSCLAAGALVAPAGAATAPPKPFGPLPSDRQLQWHELAFYGFVHFSPNTFTDKEWGYGDEPPAVFNPTDFDADQIARAAKDAGMNGLILTAKHHDGFCLWPSQFTEYSIKNSPWKEGKGDVVKEFAAACERHGLKFGVYLSPWDRNHAEYGRPGYVTYYKNQLRELLTNYGPIFEMWFDGANGGDGYYGGKRERRSIPDNYYDWPGVIALIRELQPGCVICSAHYHDGQRWRFADARWGGSEAGVVGNPCWAAVDSREKPTVGTWQHGARNGDVWCPAEADVSIRPGWFYHTSQDNKVKTPDQLMDIWFASVGRGANLILNLPPDRRGQLHDNDVQALHKFHDLMEDTFGVDRAQAAVVTASYTRGNDPLFGPRNLLKPAVAAGKPGPYWATDDNFTNATVTLEFKEPVAFNIVRLREFLPLGQRVDAFALDAWRNGAWKEFHRGTGIGACRLVRGKMITTTKVRLRIINSPVGPALAEFGLFAEPYRLGPPVIRRDPKGGVTIELRAPVTDIRYTLDGTEPGFDSPAYPGRFPLTNGGTVKARAVSVPEQKLGAVVTAEFEKLAPPPAPAPPAK